MVEDGHERGGRGLTRRGFCEGSLVGAAVGMGALASGCHRREGTSLTTVDPNIGEKSHPETFAVRAPIPPGQEAALRERLEGHVFAKAGSGVHYARITVLPASVVPAGRPELLLSLVYDEHRDVALDFMADNASNLDEVLRLTEGYPAAGAADIVALGGWVDEHDAEPLMLYTAFSDAREPAVRESLALRTNFLEFVEAVQRDPSAAEALYDRFLAANATRLDTHEEVHVDQLTPNQRVSPTQTNAFTMVTTVKPGKLNGLERTLREGNWAVRDLHIHPLAAIPTVHYARFSGLGEGQMLFQSVYDGQWEQYVEDFAVHIPKQLDVVWGPSVGFPPGGAADAPALEQFLVHHKIRGDYFYSAYRNSTVKEVLASLELGRKLLPWSKRISAEAGELVHHIQRFVAEHQALLA